MLPKAGMVIRSEKTTNFSYANQGLQKNSKAVSESLKRYPLEINGLEFTGNGVRSKECIMLVAAFEPHYKSLKQIDFSENRIGFDGAKALGGAIKNVKMLETINVASNLLGDLAVNEVLKGCIPLLNLKEINLSNNGLGQKQNGCLFVESLSNILKNAQYLVKLDLSWNNLRGSVAESFIEGLKENMTIKHLDLSYNLFGLSTATNPAAAMKLSSILQENTCLEELNLSNNLIESKVAFCLAHGLRVNSSLKSFIMDGNPIGSSGIKYLIQSINDNFQGKVENIKMKETETIIPSKSHTFDLNNVEGEYNLSLDDVYDKVILYHLLDMSFKIYMNSSQEEGMSSGDCFIDAKLAGSAWTPPERADSDSTWNLGPEPTGTLTFRFSLDPKRNQKPGPKDPELPTGTIVDFKSVIKGVITEVALEKSIDLLIRLLMEDNSTCQREMVATMTQEYTFTYHQAIELLK